MRRRGGGRDDPEDQSDRPGVQVSVVEEEIRFRDSLADAVDGL